MTKINKKGFTIVELVIVIAVVAILAAVLIPTFSNVISKANHSAALQEARNKYLEVFADDIAEDGVLNITVTEAEGKGYTYTTADGKVTSFTFDKDGITVEYNVANDEWTVNGESQGGNNAGNGGNNAGNEGNVCTHPDATDDNDCSTPVICEDCSTTITPAKAHVPGTDDGNCETPVYCTNCTRVATAAITHNFTGDWEKDATGHWHVCKNDGCNQRQDFAEHTPGADATETTDQKCTICGYVITPALGHTHNHTIPGYDETGHWLACTCGDKSSVTAHTAAADDGDCTTAVTCTGCEHIMTAAKTEHEARDDDGDCTTDIICKNCTMVAVEGNANHTPDADDGDCTTAVVCTKCRAEVIAALSHTNTNDDIKCDNANCNHVMPSLHLAFDSESATGKVGKAINLNNNSYPTEYSHPSDGFTASFWIKIPEDKLADVFWDEAPLFTNKDWDSGNNSGYILFLGYKQNSENQNDPSLGYWLKFNSGNGNPEDREDILTQISPADLADWLHITVVVDRENENYQVKASFNFKEFQDLGTFNCDPFTENTLSIGKDINDKWPFDDDIYMDDFMLFDKALGQDEVTALKTYYEQKATN